MREEREGSEIGGGAWEVAILKERSSLEGGVTGLRISTGSPPS